MLLEDFSNVFDPNLMIMSLSFYIVNIILLSLVIIYIINKLYLKKEEIGKDKTVKYNFITWYLFFILILMANILKCLSLYLVIHGEPTDSFIITILYKIKVILIYLGFLVKVLYLEYTLKKLKNYKGYFFSVLISIIIVILILVDSEEIKKIGVFQFIFVISIAIGYSILPILYLYLAIKTPGQNRKDALKISAGTVFLGLGFLFRPENLENYIGISDLLNQLIGYTYITAPIGMIIATILIFASIRKKKG